MQQKKPHKVMIKPLPQDSPDISDCATFCTGFCKEYCKKYFYASIEMILKVSLCNYFSLPLFVHIIKEQNILGFHWSALEFSKIFTSVFHQAMKAQKKCFIS